MFFSRISGTPKISKPARIAPDHSTPYRRTPRGRPPCGFGRGTACCARHEFLSPLREYLVPDVECRSHREVDCNPRGYVVSSDAQAWPWPDSLDALIAAPKSHHLLFENERVRVLEVRIAPGELVPVHTHRWPSAIYIAKPSDFVRRDADGNVLFDSRTAGPAPCEPVVHWTPPIPP